MSETGKNPLWSLCEADPDFRTGAEIAGISFEGKAWLKKRSSMKKHYFFSKNQFFFEMCAILPGILWIFIINMELKCIHSERILAADSESPMSDRKLNSQAGFTACAITAA